MNIHDKILDRISNRHWDEVREKLRLNFTIRQLVRDRVWGVVSTRVWTRLARGVRVNQGRVYRRFP